MSMVEIYLGAFRVGYIGVFVHDNPELAPRPNNFAQV